MLRPGGWIIAHEPVRRPAPRSSPELKALETYWELLHQLTQHAGVPPGAVDDLPRAARSAGLEVTSAEGFFTVIEPALGFDLHASTLAAGRGRALAAGITSESEVDSLIQSIRAARDQDYEWVTSPFMLDFAFHKPEAAA